MAQHRGVVSISHHLFPDAVQRRELVAGGSVACKGWRVRVRVEDGDTDEPAKEELCLYLVGTREGTPPGIAEIPGGYEVWMEAPERWKSLLDFQDGGSAYLRAVMAEDLGGHKICHTLVARDASCLTTVPS